MSKAGFPSPKRTFSFSFSFFYSSSLFLGRKSNIPGSKKDGMFPGLVRKDVGLVKFDVELVKEDVAEVCQTAHTVSNLFIVKSCVSRLFRGSR